MANVATISITEELRPAEVQLTKDGTAWMRALVHVGRLGNHDTFVCELESGDLMEVRPGYVRFLDSAEKFGEVCFEKMGGKA